MTLLSCQIFSTIAQEGSFARAAERLHLTPSAISHAVAGMENECGFPLFTRTKAGVTMTAAAESLLPAIRRVLASTESLEQSIAQINGLHKGVLRLGVFNSACVVWLPQLVPAFQAEYPGIDVQIFQGSYADIAAWLKSGTAELGFLSNFCAQDLDFLPLYTDPLVCIAPPGFPVRRSGRVTADELRGRPFVSQRSDTDADIQAYLKHNDVSVHTACYVIDDESMVEMVACGQGGRHHAADAADPPGRGGRRAGAAPGTGGRALHRPGLPGPQQPLPCRPRICAPRSAVCRQALRILVFGVSVAHTLGRKRR